MAGPSSRIRNISIDARFCISSKFAHLEHILFHWLDDAVVGGASLVVACLGLGQRRRPRARSVCRRRAPHKPASTRSQFQRDIGQLDRAVNDLRRRAPDFSAASPLLVWQRVVLLCLISALTAGLILLRGFRPRSLVADDCRSLFYDLRTSTGCALAGFLAAAATFKGEFVRSPLR